MDENKITQFAMPFLGSLLGNEKGSIGNFINGFYKTENKDIQKLMQGAEIFKNIIENVENFHYYNKKFTKLLNTVVPHRWEEYYTTIALSYMFDFMENLPVNDKILIHIEQMKDFIKDNEDVFKYLYETAITGITDIMDQFEENNLLNDEALKEISMEYIEKYTDLIPIKEWKGVRLYHGTSYDNYLSIKEHGYIKATDYSEAKYPNEKVGSIFRKESGFVFAQDSMDQPLCFGYGGYRKNAIPWAYKDNEDNEYTDSEFGNIGVIFEINPENYEVYFHPGKQEFLIKGDIAIDDVNVMFYDWKFEGGGIASTMENEIGKEEKN